MLLPVLIFNSPPSSLLQEVIPDDSVCESHSSASCCPAQRLLHMPGVGLQLCPAWTCTKLDAASPCSVSAVCSSFGVIRRGYGQHSSAQHSSYTSWIKLPVYFDHAFARELCCYSSGKLSIIAWFHTHNWHKNGSLHHCFSFANSVKLSVHQRA